MTTTPNGLPPPAGRELVIGVTGHRRLPVEGAAALSDTLRALLARIRDGCIREADGMPRPRLVSALAEGADQIVARLALEEGYELHCPLPFARDVYRRDFAASPQAERAFIDLLARAATVVELPGDRDPQAKRLAAYVCVGSEIVALSDLLIAVWDGKPAASPGGTGDVVAEALEREMPVVAVDPATPVRPRLLDAAGETVEPRSDRDPLDDVRRVVLYSLRAFR